MVEDRGEEEGVEEGLDMSEKEKGSRWQSVNTPTQLIKLKPSAFTCLVSQYILECRNK